MGNLQDTRFAQLRIALSNDLIQALYLSCWQGEYLAFIIAPFAPAIRVIISNLTHLNHEQTYHS